MSDTQARLDAITWTADPQLPLEPTLRIDERMQAEAQRIADELTLALRATGVIEPDAYVEFDWEEVGARTAQEDT
jgi:hypothetical protein